MAQLFAILPARPQPIVPPAASFPAYTPLPDFHFEILHRSRKPGSRARVARIHTPHGSVDTPGFVPVGTNAALKGMTDAQAADCGVQLQFANTYHLLVYPGESVVAAAGGLHRFMQRTCGPLITDSGGFQVFSLAKPAEGDGAELKRRAASSNQRNEGTLLKVREAGVSFRSYMDGSRLELTPESSVRAQKAFGADIILPLDELPPYHVSERRLAQSVDLSHRWMARSLRTHLDDRRQQAMYSIIHGGVSRELRQNSVEYLASLPFDGHAVGGSLGKDRDEMLDLLGYVLPLLPEEKPNHILGIADPQSVLAAAPLGADTFDSCFPTRVARHGTLLTREGPLHIRSAKYRSQHTPVDPAMPPTEWDTSRAYMHHLYRHKEPLYDTLASMHNVRYMNRLMADIRARILADDL
jgi:queuine tRNA-ribosyltransferase